jgi:hypothetical protein
MAPTSRPLTVATGAAVRRRPHRRSARRLRGRGGHALGDGQCREAAELVECGARWPRTSVASSRDLLVLGVELGDLGSVATQRSEQRCRRIKPPPAGRVAKRGQSGAHLLCFG